VSPEKPLSTSGVAIGCSIAPSSAPDQLEAERPLKLTSFVERAKGDVRSKTRWSVAVRDALVTGSSSRTCAVDGRRAVDEVASTISSIGVMPAIASRENCPSE